MASRLGACLLLIAALLATAAHAARCGRLEADVQARLDALFGRRVLVLGSLDRQGSAPYAARPMAPARRSSTSMRRSSSPKPTIPRTGRR